MYIRDTAFEKSQHEASGKHQGNLKRFLREIHRDNERQQRDSQRAENEVERLRRTVAGSSGGKGGDEAPWKRAPAPKQEARPASMDERKKQMAQLAEMGVSIPDEFRGDMALSGEWQTVSERVIGEDTGKLGNSMGVRKRKHDGDEDEEEQEAKAEAERFVSKGWGSRTRLYPGAHDDQDLDSLLESTKDIKKPKTSDAAPEEGTKDPGHPVKREEDDTTVSAEADKLPEVKKEEQGPSEAAPSSIPATKGESEDAAPGVVFKKRKPKAMRK